MPEGHGDAADGANVDVRRDDRDPSLSGRAIRDAQEDLRRDIARAMHDGPAQSLTNIALQAQIVQRLVARDTDRAVVEVAQLVAMVQQTLEATKTFIFDVRPMVLDDLGIVPTLRRTARDRGRDGAHPGRVRLRGRRSATGRRTSRVPSSASSTTPSRAT